MSYTTNTTDTTVTSITTVTTEPATHNPLLADAVLEGGGVRGIGHVGALVEAEKHAYQWVNIAGTSAGAFVASLVAAGYKATELYDIMNEVDFRLFADTPGLDWLMAKKIFNVAIHGGIHPGQYMESFIREKLSAKGVQKFGDLIVKGQEDDPTYRYKLTVIASDISTGRMVRLPQDAHSYYGLDPDDVDVARAVHMSASIPFFFIPVDQPYSNGSICRIVDGGLLSNFPVAIFDVADRMPSRPTFGFRLVDQLPTTTDNDPVAFTPTGNAYEIMQALVHTMLTAHDRLYMDEHTYVRTIAIPTNGISGTQFNLSRAEATTLFHNGQQAAAKFFSTWDFAAYKAAYRSGRPLPGRQEQLHNQMKSLAVKPLPLSKAS